MIYIIYNRNTTFERANEHLFVCGITQNSYRLPSPTTLTVEHANRYTTGTVLITSVELFIPL
jgi:hypothetical protein